jgi:Zn-finger nucleic acid-binding protein
MAYRLVRERRYDNPFPIPELPPPPADDDVSDTEPLADEWENENQEELEELEQLEELEDDNKEQEECPICFANYNNSNRQKYIITKCQLAHPLCRSCAVEIVNLARRRHELPQCPMCRKVFTGTENKQTKTFSFGRLNKKSPRKYKSPKKSRKRSTRKTRSPKKVRNFKTVKTISRKSRTRSPRKSRK